VSVTAARWRLPPGAVSIVLACGLSGCGVASGPLDLGVKQTYGSLKYENVVRQRLDFTCGGAALATMLSHYWGRPTPEEEVLAIFRARYPDPKVWEAKAKDGFTFDDIAFATEVLGYEAAGAKVPVDELRAMNGPVIIHMDKGKFQHFVVLTKAKDDVFYIADPIVGKMALERPDFERQYTGSAMAIWRDQRPLPVGAPLARVRDGISVSSSLRQKAPTVVFDPNRPN
jgi:uncharacterized protein